MLPGMKQAVAAVIALAVLGVQQHCLEYGVQTARLDQRVGPDKYLYALPAIDGEDYGKLELSLAITSWKVVTAHGLAMSYERC